MRLHPFGRGTFVAIGLAVLSFAVIPLTVRAVAGSGAAVSVSAVAAGCCVQAAGLWWFRKALRLSALPGMSRVAKAFSFRGGSAPAVPQSPGD